MNLGREGAMQECQLPSSSFPLPMKSTAFCVSCFLSSLNDERTRDS